MLSYCCTAKCNPMSNRKNSSKITLWLPDHEKEILQAYCNRSGRTQTDVIREFIRTLEKK